MWPNHVPLRIFHSYSIVSYQVVKPPIGEVEPPGSPKTNRTFNHLKEKEKKKKQITMLQSKKVHINLQYFGVIINQLHSQY